MTLLHSAPPLTPDRRASSSPRAAVPPPRSAPGTLPVPHPFDAPVAAERALAAARPDDRDAIVWLSEHIATLHRVVYPAAARHPEAAAALREQQTLTGVLSRLLRRLHEQLAGDGAVAAEDVPSLRRNVLAALRAHSAGERELIRHLTSALTGEQWQYVASQYTERLQRGPTRPHPHTPRTGLPGRLAYRLSAAVDRTLDVLDSRAVRPVPSVAAA